MKKHLWIVAVVLLVAGTSFASPKQQPIDPQKLVAGKDLATVLVAEPSKTMLEFMTKTWRQPIMRDNPGNTKVDQVSATVQGKLWQLYKDRLVDNAARIYAQTFTVDEMHQMATFFKTPAGQKYLSTNIVVSRQVGFANSSISVEASREAQKDLVDELKRNGMRVPHEMEPAVVKKP
jgi:uncharacterized protein